MLYNPVTYSMKRVIIIPFAIFFFLFALSASFLIGTYVGSHSYAALEYANKQTFKTINNPETSGIKVSEDKIWSLIQDWRIKNGFKPYIKDQYLCEIARDRSDDKVLDNHAGFYQKYGNLKSNNPRIITENLAALNYPQLMLNAWLGSPPHRAALEKPYTHSCIACDKQCVQIFSSFLTN